VERGIIAGIDTDWTPMLPVAAVVTGSPCERYSHKMRARQIAQSVPFTSTTIRGLEKSEYISPQPPQNDYFEVIIRDVPKYFTIVNIWTGENPFLVSDIENPAFPK
jgi:hypothetical protein